MIKENMKPVFNIQEKTITLKVKSNEDIQITHREPIHKEYKKALYWLIESRIHHCEEQLVENTLQNNTLIRGEVIHYGDGGHFSIPVYDALVRFVNNEIEKDRLIVQQALRQYLLLVRTNDESLSELEEIISREDIEGCLTEDLLVIG